MKKILFIALLAITAISCDKKDVNNTNSIEGRWMISQFSMTSTQIGTETDLFDNSTDSINDTEIETVSGDSLDGLGIEILSDGSAILFDNSDNDTITYSYSNSTLTIYGDDFIFDEDTSIIDVSNLTSNSMNWNYTYTEREIENDSSQGYLSDLTFTENTTISFVK